MTGVEPAEPWYRRAVEREAREPLGIAYLQADLSTLELADRFNAVVANMVLMDIPDYATAITRSVALLAPGGDFVFSLVHPCFEEASIAWAEYAYVAVPEYLAEYTIPQTFAARFHRPLSHYLNYVIDAGCTLRRILEPRLDPAWACLGPAYERSVHVPTVVVHATRA